MISWHRTTMKVDGNAAPIMVYYTNDRDWRDWTIDRIPCSNGSRTYWYEYQLKYNGTPVGLRQYKLRDAKQYIEREGRNGPDKTQLARGATGSGQ